VRGREKVRNYRRGAHEGGKKKPQGDGGKKKKEYRRIIPERGGKGGKGEKSRDGLP